MTAVPPSGAVIKVGPAATMAGRPRVRARIAVCEVGPPTLVASPRTCLVSRCRVSDGVRSSATRIEGSVSAICCRSMPSSWASTCSPTSRRSIARAASSGSATCCSLSMRARSARCQDQAAPWPCMMVTSASRVSTGSASSSRWAAKMAASAALSRWRVRPSSSSRSARTASSACSSASPSATTSPG